jgi:hypothetical protein
MKFLSIFLILVFLLSCTASAQEKKNPFAGSTWELISAKYEREDTTFIFPNSSYEQAIMIFGETYYNIVQQDTSRNVNLYVSCTYNVDGDNFTLTPKMHHVYEGIGKTFNLKFKIEGDQLIYKATDWHFGGYVWKAFHQEWKRID